MHVTSDFSSLASMCCGLGTPRQDSDDSYNSLHVRAQRYVSLLLANESSEPAEITLSLSKVMRLQPLKLPN
jgi:hypothetical protein